MLSKIALPLIIVFLLAIATPLLFFATSKKQDIRNYAAGPKSNKATFIFLAGDTSQLAKYQNLQSATVAVTLRTVNHDPTKELDTWDTSGWHYFVTAASSDFPTSQHTQNIYNTDLNELRAIANRPGFEGFYFREMMTYRALRSDWNWDTARDTVDWGWVEQVMQIAASKDKKVIWSEPTYAWKTLFEDKNKTIDPLFHQWSQTLVPMYATNFTAPETASAKQYAQLTANKYGMGFGESHQAWDWRSNGSMPTQPLSYNLALDGWQSGVTYFQFEGAPEDFGWNSPYMLGIRQFASTISTAAFFPAAPTSVPKGGCRFFCF